MKFGWKDCVGETDRYKCWHHPYIELGMTAWHTDEAAKATRLLLARPNNQFISQVVRAGAVQEWLNAEGPR
jgi:hypothetical protein